MSSRVSNKDVHIVRTRKQKPFLKFNELQCPTCKKCLYSANHDECVLEYLSKSRSQSMKEQAYNEDKDQEHSSLNDKSNLTDLMKECTSFNGQKQQRIDLNADALYNEKQENLRVWLLKFLISKKPHISSHVFMAMTSDHNRSELGIQDHSNEQSSSKLVPKVVPLAVKTATSRQELELLFHLHIAMLRTTGIMPTKIELTLEQSQQGVSNDVLVHKLLSRVLRNIIVIFARTFRVILFSIHNDEWKSFQCHHQTALRMSMLVKDTRSQDGKDDKDNDKGSKSRSQSMKEQDYNEDKDQEHSSLNDKSNLTDLMKECHQ
ncbi:hypothetical protein Tco_0018275 [Tanacetum coccineum]